MVKKKKRKKKQKKEKKLVWHRSIPTCVRLLQQRPDELQVAVDVAVDVRRPLGALVEPSQELHRGLQEDGGPGAAEGLAGQQVAGHAPHLEVTQRHLSTFTKQRRLDFGRATIMLDTGGMWLIFWAGSMQLSDAAQLPLLYELCVNCRWSTFSPGLLL